jgi:hypothetical protein
MRSKALMAFLVGLLVSMPIAPSSAHHGGGVEWQEGLEGPIVGVASKFEFRFPHVVLYVDVDSGDGVENWAMTTRWTPTILRQHGWTRNSIRPGDKLVLTYVPHVSKPAVAQMRTIEVNGEELPLQFD